MCTHDASAMDGNSVLISNTITGCRQGTRIIVSGKDYLVIREHINRLNSYVINKNTLYKLSPFVRHVNALAGPRDFARVSSNVQIVK